MNKASFACRVGGITVALGVGAVILGGTAVAVADNEVPDTSARASAATSSQSSGVARDAKRPSAVAARSATPARVRSAASVSAPVVRVATPAVSPGPARTTTERTSLTAVTTTATAVVPPSPDATVSTPYGDLGQWMLNKNGEVADWIGQPYCGPGSTVSNCGADTPGAKTVQEPINVVFVVPAANEWFAKLKLDFALRVSGFGPSCCSSIGYRAIVDGETDPQMPTGGLLGLGVLPPLPFGLGQTGLLGLIGFGPAYRDAPFFLANSHLRVFGGQSDGNGAYIFTGSASEENLDTSAGGLLPTHGYESFETARTALTQQMLNVGWLTGASNLGQVAMYNAIPADDPSYTTGDADGFAQVIGLGALFGSSPTRSVRSSV